MKFLAALVCVLAVATATPSGIAHGGFGYSSVTAHTAALAAPAIAHHVPVAHHAALTAPVAVAHHAALTAPVAVAHHAAIAAPVAHTAVSHSSITQHHHAAAPVVHHAAVAHAAPLVHHTAVAHAAPLVHHTAAVHAAPVVAHHAHYAAAPVTVAHHAAVAHAAPVAVAHHANYAVAHHANIAAAPVAVAHHAAVHAPVAVAHHAAVHAPVAVAHHAAVHAPVAVAHHAAYAAPIAAVGIEKTQYHAQDVLGQASYGHAEAFQRHDAIQDAAGNKVGSYSWVAPDGQVVAGKYVADALGYRVHSNALPVGPAPIGETAEVVAARSAHYAAHAVAGSHRFRRGIAAIHTPALAYSAAIRSPFQYTAHTSPITLSHYVHHTPLHYGLY